MLRAVLGTKNELTMPMSGTGSAGMETCLVNAAGARRPGAGGCTRRVRPEAWPRSPARRSGGRWPSTRRGAARSTWIACARRRPGPHVQVAVRRARGDLDRRTHAARALSRARRRARRALPGGRRDLARRARRWRSTRGDRPAYSGTQKCLSCPPGLSPVTPFDASAGSAHSAQDAGPELVPRSESRSRVTGAASGSTTTPRRSTCSTACTRRCVWRSGGLDARYARHRATRALGCGAVGTRHRSLSVPAKSACRC